MPTTIDLVETLEQLQAKMADMAKRIAELEAAKAIPVPAPPSAPIARAAEVPAGITEEEVLAISAAIGAFLGVRAHIRQIRLLSSNAWAQQGRVSIQASHILQG